jgi:UDP-GlcNAc:undecaprenyl-phosphate GlcNAc-1-phosphate transferase
VHTRVVPRLGGLAVVAGFFAPLAALAFTQSDVAAMFYADPLRSVGLAVGGVIIASLGAWDDIRGVRAWHKLAVQLLAALVAWGCGFRMEHLTLPFVGELDLGVFGLPFTLLWIAAVVNAMNLIDGLDGLAGGIAFFACLTNFVVAALNGNPLVMLLAAALGGAILGFLLYNFNPATIFMGDSGSMFLGFVLATTSMMGASIQGSTTVAILVPLISLGVPIMDTLFAMVRRIVERRPIFSPDRGHIHHRLLDLGITHRRAVLILYGVSIVFTAGAITIALGRNWSVGVALLVLTVAMLGLARFVGYFEYLQIRRRQKQHIHSRSTERLRVAVPELIRGLEDIDREDVPAMLERFANVAELLEIELEASGSEPLRGLPAVRWTAREDAYSSAAREPVRASFEVGSARASLKVAWLSDDGDVSPQADILLQIVADAIDRCVKASLPAPAPAAAELMEPEVVEHLRDSRPA